MQEIHQIARSYYDSGTDQERNLFREFFRSIDQDGNDLINFREFEDFTYQEGRQDLRNRHFFNQLDGHRSGSLNFDEVMTLYYIIKSGRPICQQCQDFITGTYFTCMTCFNHSSYPFSVCLTCYRDQSIRHNHGLEQFVDNFALLESKRKSGLTAVGQQNQNQPIANSSQALVQYYHPYPPWNSTSLAIPAQRPNSWRTALRILEAGLHLASVVSNCTIM